MASHHFIGKGRTSRALREAASSPDELAERIENMVQRCGLSVVNRQQALFPGGGLTLVWVLAESHLVLHYWAEEGFSTLDLHVCDYKASNESNAERLRQQLEAFCFEPSTAAWHSLAVEDPVFPVATPVAT